MFPTLFLLWSCFGVGGVLAFSTLRPSSGKSGPTVDLFEVVKEFPTVLAQLDPADRRTVIETALRAKQAPTAKQLAEMFDSFSFNSKVAAYSKALDIVARSKDDAERGRRLVAGQPPEVQRAWQSLAHLSRDRHTLRQLERPNLVSDIFKALSPEDRRTVNGVFERVYGYSLQDGFVPQLNAEALAREIPQLSDLVATLRERTVR